MKHWPYITIAVLIVFCGVLLWSGGRKDDEVEALRARLSDRSERVRDSMAIRAMLDSAAAQQAIIDTLRAQYDSMRKAEPTVIVRYKNISNAIRDAHIDVLQDSLGSWPSRSR